MTADILILRPAADRTREHSALVNAVAAELGDEPDFRLARMNRAGNLP